MEARLQKEERWHEATLQVKAIMKALDGKVIQKNRCEEVVNDVNKYGINLNGRWYEVNLDDCD